MVMVIRWGGTCGEGFSEPASKWHLDNRDNVEKIGREVSQKATSLIDCGNDKTQHQVEISVRAGGRDDGKILTASMVYNVRTTEGEFRKRVSRNITHPMSKLRLPGGYRA